MQKITREIRKQQWMQIMHASGESGQTIRAYCKENGIKESSYYYWQRRLRESACESLMLRQEADLAQVPAPAFAEVRLTQESLGAGAITVRLGDAVVEIAGNAPPMTIETVLRMLMNR